MDSFLVCLNWTVQVNLVSLIAVVLFFTVMTLWGIFSSRKKEANYINGFSNKYYDVKSDNGHEDTGEKKNAKDYKGLFEQTCLHPYYERWLLLGAFDCY